MASATTATGGFCQGRNAPVAGFIFICRTISSLIPRNADRRSMRLISEAEFSPMPPVESHGFQSAHGGGIGADGFLRLVGQDGQGQSRVGVAGARRFKGIPGRSPPGIPEIPAKPPVRASRSRTSATLQPQRSMTNKTAKASRSPWRVAF